MAALSEHSPTTSDPPSWSQTNLEFEDSVLRLTMPVEAYDCMMDHGTLPLECCYQADMMEVGMPSGIEHDRRAAAVCELLTLATAESGREFLTGATIPVKSRPGSPPGRRHPDAHLYLDPAKVERLRLDRSDPVPPPDIVVEIDWTPITSARAAERLAAYAAALVPEVWVWTRAGSGGLADIHVLGPEGYAQRAASAAIPVVADAELSAILNEADEISRKALIAALSRRVADYWRETLTAP